MDRLLESSTVASLVRRERERVRRLARSSRVVDACQRAVTRLRAARADANSESGVSEDGRGNGWPNWLEASAIAGLATTVGTTAARTAETARVRGLADRVLAVTQGSAGYEWLTAEPEPEVIVIDLRETYAVGPVIDAIDRTIAFLLPSWHRAMLRQGADAMVRTCHERPLGVLGGLLACGAVASLAVVVATGAGSPAVALAHVGALLAAIVGLRSERTWADIQDTRAFELLIAAFEPPEPPERVNRPPPSRADDSPGGQSPAREAADTSTDHDARAGTDDSTTATPSTPEDSRDE